MSRRLLLVGLLILPMLSPSTAALALEIKRMALDNGAILLVSPQHHLPMVTVAIAFDAGSRRDPLGKEGLADLTASCLTEGTKALTAEQVNQKIDFMGSALDVSAGQDYATASFTALKRYTPDTLGLMAQILTEPALKDEDILRKRAEALADLKSADEQPGYVAQREFTHLLFGNTPYGHLTAGTTATVEKLAPQDVRDFYRKFYRPKGAIIAVVGDVDPANIKDALNKALDALKGEVPAQPAPPPPVVAPGAHVTTINRDVAQANLVLGYGGVARSNPDYYKLQVMNYILGGGGFASRLVREVRSKAGLAYSVRSGFRPGLFAGSFEVVLQTKNHSANKAIHMVLDQMELMRQQAPPASDVENAKKFLIGSFPLKIDTQSSIAQFLLQIELYGLGLDYADRYPKLVGAVTVQDVQEVARKYLHPDAYILVAVANQHEANIDVASGKAAGN